jgi:hypothetical protein
MMEINAWVPNDGALQWNQITDKTIVELSALLHFDRLLMLFCGKSYFLQLQ